MYMYFFREHNYHSRMIREFSISCDFTHVTLVGDGVTKAMLNHWKVIVTCIVAALDKGRILLNALVSSGL